MINVVLPIQDEDIIKEMQRSLQEEQNLWFIYCSIDVDEGGNSVEPNKTTTKLHFARLSSQIYLELSDFQFLADAVTNYLSKKLSISNE